MKRDFLSLKDWSAAELDQLLQHTAELKRQQQQSMAQPLLAGQTLGMLFEKSSTRTRVSFEVGMYQLGGHALFLPSSNTQSGRGEPIKDTARVMSRYVNGLMIRTFSQEDVAELAQQASIPVINGLTDYCHPCQVMADLFTVQEKFGTIRQPVYAWVGDGNNMAVSWLHAAGVLGLQLRIATPEAYAPCPEAVAWARKQGAQIQLTQDPYEAVQGAQVLSTDVWTSMGQETQQTQRNQAFLDYQLNQQLLEQADPDAMVLHCLPAHRGEEITEEVIEGPHSWVFTEAENRLHAQKAIMARLMGGVMHEASMP